MRINQVLTNRNQSNGKDYGIVNEWEDIFSEVLGVPLYYDNWKKRDKLLFWKFPWFATLFQTNVPTFMYVMLPTASPHGNNKRNIIPCMIDFYSREDKELRDFYSRYDKNPIVLISSREAYDFLISVRCPLNIKHLPLSISDKYRVCSSTRFAKRYDVVMLGRQNIILQDYLKLYSQSHKDLTYVYGEKEGRYFRYYDDCGKDLGCLTSREDYMRLMRLSRIGLYSTPAMDGGRTDTNGFNQVTPRFLEYIVNGCHVISRYPRNSDTEYFELDTMSTKIETYDDFEAAMDKLRFSEVDMDKYSRYLEKHYTSVRVKTLMNYIEEI